MIQKLHQRILDLAAHPRALWIMAAVSFAESSFFPIPPDIMLVPMCLAKPKKTWVYGAVCTVASVLGGIFGYILGWMLFDTLGGKIVAWYGLTEKFAELQTTFAQHAFTIIALKGLTPIPYKLVTISSGMAAIPMSTFLSASILTRGLRFMMLSGLTSYFGPRVRAWLDQNMTLFYVLMIVGILIGFYVLRFV